MARISTDTFRIGLLFRPITSLRIRLVALVLIALVPLFILTFLNAASQRDYAIKAAQERATLLAQSVASEQERMIEGSRQLLLGLSRYPVLLQADRQRCNAEFGKILTQFPQYTGIWAVNPEGYITCTAVPADLQRSYADQTWFTGVVETGNFVVTEYRIGLATGLPTLPMAYPITNESGQLIAIIGAGLSIDWISQLTGSSMTLPEGASIIVVDRFNTILAHPTEQTRVGQVIPDQLARELVDSQGTFILDAFEGESYLFAYSALIRDNSGVRVLISVPTETVSVEADLLLSQNLAAMAVITLLAMGTAWFGGNILFVRHMKRLIEATQRLAKGDLNVRTEVPNDIGEIAALALSFNIMAERIQARESELEHANAALKDEYNERLRAQEKAREKDRLFRAIFENSFQMIGITDKDGIVLEVNRKTEDFNRVTRDVLIGKPMGYHPVHKFSEPAQRQVDMAIASASAGQFVRYEVNQIRDGKVLYSMDVSLMPVFDDDGNVNLIIIEARDIVERKQAELDLQNSERLYRALAQNLPNTTVFLFDRDMRFLVVEGEELLKRQNTPREMMEKRRLQEVLPSDWVALLEPYYQKTLNGEESYLEREWLGYAYATHFVPVRNEHGEVFAGLVVTQDVTPRIQAANELREARDKLEIKVRERTADLKAANDELSTFTYIVSHDLRSPLVNLRGFSSELRTSVESIKTVFAEDGAALSAANRTIVEQALNQDIPEALEFINSAVSRMDRLTHAVLKLSRLGRRDLSIELIDLSPLIDDIFKSLAHQIKQQHVHIRVHELPSVRADRIAMEQIMGNLLTNAVMYLRPDVQGVIEITGIRDESNVTISVCDNGRGIAEPDKPKVFEPFRRVGRITTPGEGMGLAYVRTLVQRHGGKIWFESEVNVGTTFSFTIPHEWEKE
jgi:PAS domain S-box-containing protein